MIIKARTLYRLRAFGNPDDSKRLRSDVSSLQSAATAMVLAADDDHTNVSTSTAITQSSVLEEDDEIARAIAMSMMESTSNLSSTGAPLDNSESNAKEDDGEELIPIPVNEELLRQLVVEMGFSDTRARKGLTHGSTVEGAIQYIQEHEDDPMIDQPYMVKRSDALKESERKVPLTEEEVRAKLAHLKVLCMC